MNVEICNIGFKKFSLWFCACFYWKRDLFTWLSTIYFTKIATDSQCCSELGTRFPALFSCCFCLQCNESEYFI